MKMKKLLAAALAATMMLSSMVTSMVASAETTNTVVVDIANINAGDEVFTANFDIAFDTALEAPHLLFDVAAEGATLTDVVSNIENEVNIDAEQGGTNYAAGKFLVEGMGSGKYVDAISLTATFALEKAAAEGDTITVDVVVTDNADWSENTIVIAAGSDSFTLEVAAPECDHANAELAYDKETALYTKTCECGYEESFAPIVSDEAISIPFTATTLDLNDSIGLIYYIAASSVAGADDFYLNVDHKISDASGNSKNDVNIEGTFSAGYGGEYKFAYPDVAAKEMMDDIYATIYVVKDGYIYSTEPITFNPRNYVDNQLKKSSDSKLKTLLVDMLNYGAEAQKQFSYNTDELANANLSSTDAAFGTSEVPVMSDALNYGDQTATTVKHSIPTLSLENKVEIVYYVTDPTAAVGDVENLSLVVENKGNITVIPWADFDYVSSYKEYKTSFAGLAAKEMGAVVKFTVYENYGTDSQVALSSTMEYSIESYAYSRKPAQGQIYTTSIAMVRYGRSALAFFGA